jgi:hypothetical protein
MTSCNLSLRYTLAADAGDDDARPRFAIEPHAGDAHQVRFTAANLRSVDRLDVRWSSVDRMKEDPVKAYLSKIGARGRAANTPAQQSAARANGKQGGRPVGSKDSKPRKRRADPAA